MLYIIHMRIDERLGLWFQIRLMAREAYPKLGGNLVSYKAHTPEELTVIKEYLETIKNTINEFELD